jgi:hypothetical protein
VEIDCDLAAMRRARGAGLYHGLPWGERAFRERSPNVLILTDIQHESLSVLR